MVGLFPKSIVIFIVVLPFLIMIQKATDTYSCIDTDILNMIQELFLKTIRNDKGDPYGSYEEIMCIKGVRLAGYLQPNTDYQQ